jgi:hypothetical protein
MKKAKAEAATANDEKAARVIRQLAEEAVKVAVVVQGKAPKKKETKNES